MRFDTSKRQSKHFRIAAFHSQNLWRAWSNRFKVAQNTSLKIPYSFVEIRFAPQVFEADVWQKQIDVLPCAYFVAESRLALKALHADLLANANPEVRKWSKRLHAIILCSEVEQLLKSEDSQASSEVSFAPTSSISIGFHEIFWLSSMLTVSPWGQITSAQYSGQCDFKSGDFLDAFTFKHFDCFFFTLARFTILWATFQTHAAHASSWVFFPTATLHVNTYNSTWGRVEMFRFRMHLKGQDIHFFSIQKQKINFA